jgi:hypothetical protein
MLPRNKRGASCRAALLGIVIGEERPFVGYAVDVRRPTPHHAAMVGADVPNADVIGHDDENVWFFACADTVGAPAMPKSVATVVRARLIFTVQCMLFLPGFCYFSFSINT